MNGRARPTGAGKGTRAPIGREKGRIARLSTLRSQPLNETPAADGGRIPGSRARPPPRSAYGRIRAFVRPDPSYPSPVRSSRHGARVAARRNAGRLARVGREPDLVSALPRWGNATVLDTVMMLVAVMALGGSLWAYSQIHVWGLDDMPNIAMLRDQTPSEAIATAAYYYIATEGRWLNALLFPMLQHLSGKLTVYLDLAFLTGFWLICARRCGARPAYAFSFAGHPGHRPARPLAHGGPPDHGVTVRRRVRGQASADMAVLCDLRRAARRLHLHVLLLPAAAAPVVAGA